MTWEAALSKLTDRTNEIAVLHTTYTQSVRAATVQIIDSSHGSSGLFLISSSQSPDVSLSGGGRSMSAIAANNSRDCLISAANAGPVVAGSSSARATRTCNATKS